MTAKEIINVDPELMGGTPVFRGTRIPIQTLFDHLEEGDSIDIFFDDFPGVSRDQVLALLEMAKLSIIEQAKA